MEGISHVVLKECDSELTLRLVKLYRLCLSTSTYPSCWKFANIQPVPKKGDRSNPSNYSYTALISCFSKSFESVFNERIMRHLSAHNFLSLISSMVPGLLVIFIFQLNFGHPFLSETFAVSLEIEWLR